MPKWLGLLLAFGLLCGLATLPDWHAIGALLAGHWPGLVPVSLTRFVPIFIAAEGWRMVLLGPVRRDRLFCFSLMWLREAINGLMPSAKVGGELASIVLLRKRGLSAAAAIAATLVETFVSIIALALLAMIGGGWLSVRYGGVAPAWIIVGGLSMIALFVFLLLFAPRIGLLGYVIESARGLWPGSAADTQWPRQAQSIVRWLVWYARHIRLLTLCWICQCAAWALGAVELSLAAWVLDIRLPLGKAAMMEAVIQAAANALPFLPAGLGAQEAAFLAVGGLLGLTPAAAATLALARRGRDLLIYVPAIARWSSRIAVQTSSGCV